MTFTEFLIIYLSIAAPFAVHFFLQNRRQNQVILKSLAAGFLWIFYAVRLLSQNFDSNKNTAQTAFSDSQQEQQVGAASQNLLKAFLNLQVNDENLTFFNLRLSFERYVGLTLAVQNSSQDSEIRESELEVFRLAGRKQNDLELAGRCLHRRNFLRLQAHQIHARQDFLQIIVSLNAKFQPDSATNKIDEAFDRFINNALYLTDILNDSEAKRFLSQLSLERQKKPAINVKISSKEEKERWKTLPTEQSLTRLRASTLNLSQTKD